MKQAVRDLSKDRGWPTSVLWRLIKEGTLAVAIVDGHLAVDIDDADTAMAVHADRIRADVADQFLADVDLSKLPELYAIKDPVVRAREAAVWGEIFRDGVAAMGRVRTQAIRELVDSGLSQTAVAAHLGISRARINDILNDR